MPKFLDVPQWYVSDGTLMSLPKDKPSQYLSTLKTNSDGTTKWEKAAVDSCNGSTNGGAMIFAPTSSGVGSGCLLVPGTTTNQAPTWLSPSYYTNGVLASTGGGGVQWKNIVYQHVVKVEFESSSYDGRFVFSVLDESNVLYNSASALMDRSRVLNSTYDSEENMLPVSGGGYNVNNGYQFYGAYFNSASVTLYGIQSLSSGTVQDNSFILTKSYITSVHDIITYILYN